MICVCHEKNAGKGEDACAHGPGYAVVCDGLGGSGAQLRRHSDGREWTEAKIAATAAADALGKWIPAFLPHWTQWMREAGPEEWNDVARHIAGLCQARIDEALTQQAAQWEATLLPTTVAAWMVFEDVRGNTLALALWAGDSRCYALDGEAMRLYSRDDVREDQWLDPMEELLAAGSPPMNNIACVGRNWVLNARVVPIERDTLLIACSDGVYGYLDSPMHLEYVLRLCHEYETEAEMQTDLEAFFAAVSGDDATLAMLPCVGPEADFASLRALLGTRLPELQAAYIDVFPKRPAPAAYYDIEQQLQEAAGELCAEHGFEDALCAYMVRRAEETDSLPEGLPCAGTIRRMRSMTQEMDTPQDTRVHDAARAWYAAFMGRRRHRGKAERELARIAGRMVGFSRRAAIVSHTCSPRGREKLRQDGREMQKDLIKWIAILREGYGIECPYPGEAEPPMRETLHAQRMEAARAYAKRACMQDARWFLRRWLNTGCAMDELGLTQQAMDRMRHSVACIAGLKTLNAQSDQRHCRYKEEIRALWRSYSRTLMAQAPAYTAEE